MIFLEENNCKHNEEELFQNWKILKLVDKNEFRVTKKEVLKKLIEPQNMYIYRENTDHKINVNYSNTFKICQINNEVKYLLFYTCTYLFQTSLLYSIAA